MQLHVDYEVFDDVPPSDASWKEWRSLVESEEWTSDDCSVLTLIPTLPTTHVVVAKRKDDGKYIGSVVWNEYDSISFIGFYLTMPEYRGKGIGSVLWKRAWSRMQHCSTIALRAVSEMKAKYQLEHTPIEVSTLTTYNVPIDQLVTVIEKHGNKENQDRTIHNIKDLSPEDFQKMLDFDKSVVGRDRSQFLRSYHNLSFTTGCVSMKNDKITARAALTPTMTPDSHLYKLAPIYADSLSEAIDVIRPMILNLKEKDPLARVLFHVLSGSSGAKELIPILDSLGIPPKPTLLYTLFSKPYANSIDISKVYIPNNNAGHFDA